MNDADRKELMDLIAEYRTAVIVEGGSGRIRQLKRIVKHVEAVEAATIERCAKFMESRANEIAAADSCTANMMAAIYRDEANSLRALLQKEE